MKCFTRTALVAFAACMLQAPSAHAQADVEAAQASPHAQLYDAMQSGVDQSAIFDNTLAQLAQQFVTGNPQLAALEREYPGIVKTLIANMRPVLETYSTRVQREYRPQMIAAIAEVMTDEESLALAEFYNSDIGRRLLQSATENYSVASTGQDVVNGGAITEESITRDMGETGMRAFMALSTEDRAELMRAALSVPGYRKLPQLQQSITPVRTAMENAPPNPQEQEGIVDAVTMTIESYLE